MSLSLGKYIISLCHQCWNLSKLWVLSHFLLCGAAFPAAFIHVSVGVSISILAFFMPSSVPLVSTCLVLLIHVTNFSQMSSNGWTTSDWSWWSVRVMLNGWTPRALKMVQKKPKCVWLNIRKEPTWCNLAVCLLITAILLYMFRTLFASILRST